MVVRRAPLTPSSGERAHCHEGNAPAVRIDRNRLLSMRTMHFSSIGWIIELEGTAKKRDATFSFTWWWRRELEFLCFLCTAVHCTGMRTAVKTTNNKLPCGQVEVSWASTTSIDVEEEEWGWRKWWWPTGRGSRECTTAAKDRPVRPARPTRRTRRRGVHRPRSSAIRSSPNPNRPAALPKWHPIHHPIRSAFHFPSCSGHSQMALTHS